MRPPSGDRLDDALDMWHSDSWDCPGGQPVVSIEQLAHGLVVLERWFRDEFAARKTQAPVRPKPPKLNRAKPQVDKGSQHQGRTLVAARSGGLCEICALAPAREWHHRKNRSQGGTWAASNGMHLCPADHAWITEHPDQAAANGWTVRSYHDPAVTTCLRRGKWVLLDNEGGVSAVDEGAA